MTQVMKASEVRQQWGQLINKVFRNQTRIVVEKSGIPVAAVISAEDLQRFVKMEEQRAERFKALDKIRDAFKDIPEEKLQEEVNKALNDVRIENSKNSS
jgi:prevent-host-death family protein